MHEVIQRDETSLSTIGLAEEMHFLLGRHDIEANSIQSMEEVLQVQEAVAIRVETAEYIAGRWPAPGSEMVHDFSFGPLVAGHALHLL